MRVGSMFTGYGGLDMACMDYFGASLAWYAEVEPAACRVLAAHYPGVENLGDVTRVDWSDVEPVDVITAGYPCQPFSTAGKRKGKSDERHLYPFVSAAIGALEPSHVVLENVAGHLSMGLADVIGDLAGLGYDARWGVVRASDAGAPHQRARVFIVANPEERGRGEGPGSAAAQAGRGFAGTGDDSGFSANPGGRSFARTGAARVGLSEPAERRTETAADCDDAGCSQCGRCVTTATQQPAAECASHLAADSGGQRHGSGQGPAVVGRVGCTPEGIRRTAGTAWQEPGAGGAATAANTDSAGSEARVDSRRYGAWLRVECVGPANVDWGKYALAIARWEFVLDRAVPSPTIPGVDGRPRLSPIFVEWMMGLPEGHVTGHGLSSAQALKMLGNGVVPQQAHLALGMLA